MTFKITETEATAITTLKRKDKEAKCFKIMVLCFHCASSYEIKLKELKTHKSCCVCSKNIDIGAHIKKADLQKQIELIQTEMKGWVSSSYIRITNPMRMRKLHNLGLQLIYLNASGKPKINKNK